MSTWGRRGLSRAVRTRILDRDGHVCQLGYDGCTDIATEIDDIVPVSQLGGVSREELTDDNRQSACHACHAVKTEAERLAAWRAAQQRRRERLQPTVPHPGDR